MGSDQLRGLVNLFGKRERLFDKVELVTSGSNNGRRRSPRKVIEMENLVSKTSIYRDMHEAVIRFNSRQKEEAGFRSLLTYAIYSPPRAELPNLSLIAVTMQESEEPASSMNILEQFFPA